MPARKPKLESPVTDAAPPIAETQIAAPKRTGRGGSRAGAGRRPRAQAEAIKEVAEQVKKAQEEAVSAILGSTEEQIKERIPLAVVVATSRLSIGEKYSQVVDSLFTLMEGGTQVTKEYQIAALITKEAVSSPDSNGRVTKYKELAFPELNPDALVLVSVREVTYPPDASTTQFLYNRLAGKPAEERTDPLDETAEGDTRASSREEMFMDFMEMMFSRIEAHRQSPPPQAAPQPPISSQAALPAPEVTE